MKKILIPILLISIFTSCKKRDATEGIGSAGLTNLSDFSVRESKLYFAKTLATAVSKDESLRLFIKEEALKQFDHDYDVFYQSVKNTVLSDGQTFDQKLQKHASSKDSLANSIKKLPLLTIMIPELGEINPENWNPNTEIPFVAVEPEKYSNKESVVCFSGKSERFEIPYGKVPGSISLVVKDNERITVEYNNTTYVKGSAKNALMSVETKNSNSNTFLNENGMRFSFTDEVFDNVNNKQSDNHIANSTHSISGRLAGPRDRPTKPVGNVTYTANTADVQPILNATSSGVEWVRDYIYYGINPAAGIDRGPLKRNVKECLTYIRFINPAQAFEVIGKNPGDPQPVDVTMIYQEWTNGSYEFRLTVLLNTKNGPSAQVHKTIYVKPSELFVLGYRSGGSGGEGPRTPFREPYIGAANNYKLPIPLPIAGWDLENVSFGWQVYLIKYNNQATVTTSVTTTNTYAANFEFSASIGENIKLGPKFGGSATTSKQSSYQLTQVFGPSDFGDAILNYSDPIFLTLYNNDPGITYYKPYEINLGSVYLTFEPRTVF